MLGEMLTSLAALTLVIGLILGMAYLMRRFKLGPVAERLGADKSMRVLESKMLDTRHHLLLVDWRDTEYLIVSSGNSIAVVDSKPSQGDRALVDEEESQS